MRQYVIFMKAWKFDIANFKCYTVSFLFMQVMPFSTACNTPLSNFESGQNYKDVVDPAGSARKWEILQMP